MMTKTEHLKIALLKGEYVSGLDALKEYGLYRLSATIHRLKQKEIPEIRKIIVKVDKQEFARYYIPIKQRPQVIKRIQDSNHENFMKNEG